MKLMMKASWGSKGEYLNSGRLDIGDLVLVNSSNDQVLKRASPDYPLQDPGQNVVYITFGSLASDSQLSRPYEWGERELYSKSLAILPMTFEYERLINLAQAMALARGVLPPGERLVLPLFKKRTTMGTFPSRSRTGENGRDQSPSKASTSFVVLPVGPFSDVPPGGVYATKGGIAVAPTNCSKEELQECAKRFSSKNMPVHMATQFLPSNSWSTSVHLLSCFLMLITVSLCSTSPRV